jgi:hypothetical protein
LKKGLSDILAEKTVKHWLEEAIDKHLETPYGVRRSVDTFHPSWAGKCPRMIQLTMTGVLKESDPNAKSQRIFDTGHSMHNRYGEYFKKMKILLGKEIPVYYEKDGIIIKGNADYTVIYKQKKVHLLELKSMNSRRFNELCIANLPVYENFLQWNIYSKCLDIPIGELLYENKDDQNMKIFSLVYNEEKFLEVFDIFLKIKQYTEEDTLYPIFGKCEDKYCSAKSLCKEENKK